MLNTIKDDLTLDLATMFYFVTEDYANEIREIIELHLLIRKTDDPEKFSFLLDSKNKTLQKELLANQWRVLSDTARQATGDI